MNKEDLFQIVLELREGLLRQSSENHWWEDAEYRRIRGLIIEEKEIIPFIPKFVLSVRTIGEFWYYISNKYEDPNERWRYIFEEFAPVLDFLEFDVRPGEEPIEGQVAKLPVDAEQIKVLWIKSLNRSSTGTVQILARFSEYLR